jgi:hypothetical protein
MDEDRAPQRALLPVPEDFLFSGRTGHPPRRDHSAGALSPRGILARKWPGTRPVFGKAPDGAPEKVRTEKGLASKRPSLPLFSSRSQRYHRARLLDRFGIPSGFFFTESKRGGRVGWRGCRVRIGKAVDFATRPHPAVDSLSHLSDIGSPEIDLNGSSVHW